MGLFARLVPALVLAYGLAVADQFAATYSDILPAITWASLDLGQVRGPDPQSSWERMLTSDDRHNYTQVRAGRRRRTLTLSGDASFVMSVKLVMPLLTISEDAKVQLELPIGYDLGSPFGGRDGGDWQPAQIGNRLEDMVAMLGLDGQTCVQRAVCELAASPSLQPQGLVGEMIHVFVRRLLEASPAEDEGQYSEAGLLGRTEGECWRRFSKCSHSLFSLAS